MKYLLLMLFATLPLHAAQLHYFGSINYARTNLHNKNITYDGIDNKWGASNLYTAGITVSQKIDEKSSALIQVVHQKDDEEIDVDLVQYQRNIMGYRVRLGRQRLANLLTSEIIQVNALLPWLSAPAEVYDKTPIRSFTGVSLEREFESGFGFSLYGGDSQDTLYEKDQITTIDTDYIYGTRLNFHASDWTGYINYITTKVKVSREVSVPIAASTYGTYKLNYKLPDFEMYTAGTSFKKAGWLLNSEYIMSTSGNGVIRRQDAAYISAGKYFTEKLLLLSTFSTDFTRESIFLPSMQTSYALNLNYNIDFNTVIKVGYTHVDVRQRTSVAPTPTGTSNLGYGFSPSTPSENFDIFDAQLAFVF